MHTFDDFKKEGDLLMPHTVRLSVNGKEVPSPKVKLSSLKVNAEIPATTFAPPK